MGKNYGYAFIGYYEGLKTTLADYLEHREEYDKLIETVKELYANNKQEELMELYKSQNEVGKRYILNNIILLREKKKFEELLESIDFMSKELTQVDPINFSDNCNDNLMYKNNIHINNDIKYHPNQKVKTKKKFTRRIP